MDFHDVSDNDEHIRYFQPFTTGMKAALAHRGERPNLKSRQEVLEKNEFFILRHKMRELQVPEERRVYNFWLPPPYPPSTASLRELKPILIKELKSETHHRGSYLLVRSIVPTERMTAVMGIGEDENEDVVALQIYQQLPEKDRPSTSVIDVNDVVIIKEPYFRLATTGDYNIRVDHVSDLIYLDPCHELVPEKWGPRVLEINKSADDLKQKGNGEFNKKEYWAAIRSYTAALESQPSIEVEKVIRLNRALAHFKDGSFDSALIDTQWRSAEVSEKGLYRASQALYELGRFSECLETLQILLAKNHHHGPAFIEATRVRYRLAEMESGIYDYELIRSEVSAIRPPLLDHASFSGPIVVKPSPGRGLGLFTTKAVKAGDLLLCEKAFAHSYAEPHKDSPLMMNAKTSKITRGAQAALITTIIHKLWKNPSLLPKFTSLHHGSYKPVEKFEVDGKPVIDTFLIEHIVSLNAIACSLASYSNATTVNPHSCGMWLSASTINHSCMSNTRRSFFGDLLFIRATCDIPADTELTFWYKPPNGDSDDVKKVLEGWGFECQCVICIDLRETSKKQSRKRMALLVEVTAIVNADIVDVAKAKRLLLDLENTYKHPALKVPRLFIREVYLKLAVAYWVKYATTIAPVRKREMAIECVDMALRALENVGFVIKDANLPAFSQASFEIEKWGIMVDGALSMLAIQSKIYAVYAPHLYQQARVYALLAHNICCPADLPEDVYRNINGLY